MNVVTMNRVLPLNSSMLGYMYVFKLKLLSIYTLFSVSIHTLKKLSLRHPPPFLPPAIRVDREELECPYLTRGNDAPYPSTFALKKKVDSKKYNIQIK